MENSAWSDSTRTASLSGRPVQRPVRPGRGLAHRCGRRRPLLPERRAPGVRGRGPRVGDAPTRAALGQALTLHLTGQRRIQELEAEWRRDPGCRRPRDRGGERGRAAARRGAEPAASEHGRTDAPAILVTGESGTGKELVARYLHHYSPKRSRGPFQAFNCAGSGESWPSREAVRTRQGAFTGAITDTRGSSVPPTTACCSSTRIGELPPDGQALLLRVLETRSVQPVGETRGSRVSTCSSSSPPTESSRRRWRPGRFREDLYYRGERPPGRAAAAARSARRVADVRPLLAYYIARHERALKRKTMGLTRTRSVPCSQFSWPGNVRQLERTCACSLVTHAATGGVDRRRGHPALQPESSPVPGTRARRPASRTKTSATARPSRCFQSRLILDRLRRHSGDAAAAAAA